MSKCFFRLQKLFPWALSWQQLVPSIDIRCRLKKRDEVGYILLDGVITGRDRALEAEGRHRSTKDSAAGSGWAVSTPNRQTLWD